MSKENKEVLTPEEKQEAETCTFPAFAIIEQLKK